jgi:hypothetical protein
MVQDEAARAATDAADEPLESGIGRRDLLARATAGAVARCERSSRRRRRAPDPLGVVIPTSETADDDRSCVRTPYYRPACRSGCRAHRLAVVVSSVIRPSLCPWSYGNCRAVGRPATYQHVRWSVTDRSNAMPSSKRVFPIGTPSESLDVQGNFGEIVVELMPSAI